MRMKYNKQSSYFIENKYSKEQIEAIKLYYPESNYDKLMPLFPGYDKQKIKRLAQMLGVKSNNPGHRKDLTGQRFGMLTVLGIDHIDEKHVVFWKCKCDCGNDSVPVRTSQLTMNHTKSCGCLRHAPHKTVDYTGMKFGLLTAIERLPNFTGSGRTYYLCRCDCGKTKPIDGANLSSGHTKTCGCINKKSVFDAALHLSKSKDAVYQVYKHTTPSKKVYIGITSQESSRRWQGGNGYATQKKFWRAIKKYGWENIRHEIIADNLTAEEAKSMEKEKIAEYDSCNPLKGYNVYEGGNPGNEYVTPIMQYYKGIPVNFFESVSVAARLLKVSPSAIRNYTSHKVDIPDYIFEAMPRIKKHNIDENLYNIRNEKHLNIKEIVQNQLKQKTIARNKSYSKPVNQYDLDGHYIKTFISIAEAQREIPGTGSINSVLNRRGRSKTAGGFLWAYDTGDYSDIAPIKYKSRGIKE